jgi:serine protease Do
MRNVLRIGCLMVLLVAILVSVSGVAGQGDLTLAKRQEIMKGSVDITSLVLDAGELVPVWGGSGTVISEDGLVLTNAHVATDMYDEVGLDGGPMDALVIGVTTREDRPPTPMYFAEVVAYDQQIDLAVLQITRDLDGKPVDAADLHLTPVKLGDSDQVHLGDDLYVFGYPTIGEGYITFTSGRVSGFDSTELASGDLIRTWIRTDTTIAGGNSGGTGVNADGELIGVPTQLGEAEARTIVDTNGDGVIDENDTPVSIGQLNELRPINLLAYLAQEEEPAEDVNAYEPNETVDSAWGPLESGKVYQAYIGSEEDVDVYYVHVQTTDPIIVELRNINWRSDYDLFLVDSAGETLDYSWGTTESEHIEYQPRTAGTYYIVVNTYGGHSVSEPYSLVALFDGDEDLPVTLPHPAADEDQGVTVRGTIVSADTGRGVEGALFVVLQPDATVEQFLQDFLEEQTYVIGETDRDGKFVLERPIPRGESFGVILGAEGYLPQYENGWLHFDDSDPAEVDLGTFRLASQR